MQSLPTEQPPDEGEAAGEGQTPEAWQRSPIQSAPLSAVLLAADAAADLEDVLTAWARQFDGLNRPYEIIFVAYGVGAESAARVAELATRLPALRVLPHAERRGLGAALRAGVEAARHPLLFYTSCDRQYRPEDFPLLLERIDRVDLVSGCRTGAAPPLWRRWLGAGYRLLLRVLLGLSLSPPPCRGGWTHWRRRWLARWVFGVRLHDPECAFRLFRRALFRRLPVQSDGELAQVEVIAKANFLGCLMDEVAVAYLPPPAGPAPDRAARKRFRKEVAGLLRAPDFGPIHLPPEEPAPAPTPPEVPGGQGP